MTCPALNLTIFRLFRVPQTASKIISCDFFPVHRRSLAYAFNRTRIISVLPTGSGSAIEFLSFRLVWNSSGVLSPPCFCRYLAGVFLEVAQSENFGFVRWSQSINTTFHCCAAVASSFFSLSWCVHISFCFSP